MGEVGGRFALKVSTAEVAGPSGRGSRAERDARIPRPDSGKDSRNNDEIARAAVPQATKRTFANRGRKLDLSNVIDHLNGRIWTPGTGWHVYNGTVGPHVHVQAAPIKTGTPACA